MITAVYSPKGGSGKTTIALNLAAALAANHAGRVLLFDLALPYNHAALLAKMAPTRYLADAAGADAGGFHDGVLAAVARHRGGFGVLTSVRGPEDARHINASMVVEALAVLGPHFDHIVVDLPVALADYTLAVIDNAQKVVMVASPELSSAKDVARLAKQIGAQRLLLILNNRHPRAAMRKPDFERGTGLEVAVEVRSDGRLPEKMALSGQIATLDAPGSNVARGARLLAARVEESGAIEPLAPGRSVRLLARIKQLLPMGAQASPPNGEAAPSIPATSENTCTAAGCEARGEVQCSYRDATGAGCPTWWCGAHASSVRHEVYCRRHAGVVRVMAVGWGTIHEIKTWPTVSDRGFALVYQVARDLGHDIARLLQLTYLDSPRVRVDEDQAVRAVWREQGLLTKDSERGGSEILHQRKLVWEWSWAAANSAGYLNVIVVSVPAAGSPEVTIRADRRVVFSGVPGWVRHHNGTGQSGEATQDELRKLVIHALGRSVNEPDWRWQPERSEAMFPRG